MNRSSPHAGAATAGSSSLAFAASHALALFGLACLLTQAYVFAAWMLSPDFRPTPPGPDPIPAYSRIAMIVFQTLSLGVGAIVLVWFVHGLRRQRRIDAIRLMMIGWLSAYWLDPFLNFITPIFTYNAYLVNFGSWAEFIPGWQSEQGARITEPLLVCPPNYFFNFTATAVSGAWAMRLAEQRWPRLGLAGRVAAGYVGVWLTMSVLDVAATRLLHFDAWPGAFPGLTLWEGHFYQFPIHELLLFPSIFVICSLLLHHRDADGHTAIERGLLPAPGAAAGRFQTVLRVLVFVGLCNALNLGYTATMGTLGAATAPWPDTMPSWLSDEQCGERTGLPCATP